MSDVVGVYLLLGCAWLVSAAFLHTTSYYDAKRYPESSKEKRLRKIFAYCVLATPIWPITLLCAIGYAIYKATGTIIITLTDKEPK